MEFEAGPSSPPRRAGFSECVAAGLLFALSELLATGFVSLDAPLVAAIVAFGAVAGFAAGLLALLLPKSRVAVATLLAALQGLQWSAFVFRELSDASEKKRAASLCVAVVTAAALFLAIARPRGLVARARAVTPRTRGSFEGVAWAALLIPLGEVVSVLYDNAIVPTLAAMALPAVGAIGGQWVAMLAPRRARVGRSAVRLLLAAALVMTAVRGYERVPRVLPPPTSSAPADAPNIALIVIDTLRADHVLDGSSSPGTPSLARMAAGGANFTQAISSASWTLPSQGSLLTGIAPSEHGAVTKYARLAEDFDTVAELLHDHGYTTAAFTGGGFVTEGTGLDQGFEVFRGRAEWNFERFTWHVPLIWRVARNHWFPLVPVIRQLPQSGGLARVAEETGDWLSHRDRTRPFFLFVHTYQVHDYYVYQGGWDDTPDIDGVTGPRFAGRFRGRLWVEPKQIAAGVTAEEAAAFARIYRRRVALVDGELGPLLERLDQEAGERGLVSIVTADHGEGFEPEVRRLMHGGRLTDELLHVPLVIAAPGRIEPGTVIRDQVRLVDIEPTLLDFAGIPAPTGLQGRSLRELLSGGDDDMRLAWSEDGEGPGRKVSLRAGGWKLLREGGHWTSFDLESDPGERTNRLELAPAALRNAFTTLEQSLKLRSSTASTLDAATAEQLRQLGYTK